MPKCHSQYMIEFSDKEREILIGASVVLSQQNIDPDGNIYSNCGSDFVCQLNTISEQIKDLLEFGYIKG